MSEASKAPVPETMEGLRRQNSAYRALCASMEQTQARQTELGRKYQEAITTLDSERAANAILTEEVTALSAQVEELRGMLDRLLPETPLMGERPKFPDHFGLKINVTAGDLRHARTLLAKIKETGT